MSPPGPAAAGRGRTVAAVATAFAIAVLACGRDAEPGRDAATATDPAVRDDTVRVFLSEYMIDMPAVLDAGDRVLVIRNDGVEDHNLRIAVPGADSAVWATDGNVLPGDRVVGRVRLAPGSYIAMCDFAGHNTRGMFVQLDVRETPSRPPDEP